MLEPEADCCADGDEEVAETPIGTEGLISKTSKLWPAIEEVRICEEAEEREMRARGWE